MEYNGKLFGAIFGVLLGVLLRSPGMVAVGFFLFSMLGHWLYDLPMAQRRFNSDAARHNKRRGEFLYFLFAMGAKIAKADGKVSEKEVQYMETLMRSQLRLTDRLRKEAIQIWSESKTSPQPFEKLALAFFNAFSSERPKILDMMDILFAIAASNGNRHIHPAQEVLLKQASGIFRIHRLQYERIKERHFYTPRQKLASWNALDPHYAILGAQPHESMSAIRKKFKALALEWHPDTKAAKGASSEALRHATAKFQQINEAYEAISKARGE
ncbi:MAG: DnaJ domain-containing protein [Saprospiraceae bacterium]